VILTVTLNLALDVTYEVPGVAWGEANRVAEMRARAGGKGVNVARVLHALGDEAVVTGLAGGPTGDAVRADLAAAGLPDALVPIAAETRRTVAVIDGERGGVTGFWAPGPPVTAAEWRRFTTAFGRLLAGAAAVVLSGSLPASLPTDAYAALCREAADAGVPAILDTSGDALRRGLAGRPALIKPNAAELAEAVPGGDDPVRAAEELRRAGAGAVVASLGEEGLVAVAAEGRWRAWPPERVSGNPTGAGDAAVAALAAGLVAGTPWPERIVDAAALSAAAVHAPVAGSFDAAAYDRYRRAVRVEPLR
jgi:tagatose 6-phosphate kinase